MRWGDGLHSWKDEVHLTPQHSSKSRDRLGWAFIALAMASGVLGYVTGWW